MHPGRVAASAAPTPNALSHRPTPADPFQVFQVRLNTAASVRRSENSAARREPTEAGSITSRATPSGKAIVVPAAPSVRQALATGAFTLDKTGSPRGSASDGAVFPV